MDLRWMVILVGALNGTPMVMADLLPTGHRHVTHELVFEDSDALANHRLVAAPIAGFSGVHVIRPGERFRFSSKYGTRFYLVPDGETDFEQFDRERFDNWANRRPPRGEIRSVPWTSPVRSALTTLRFDGVVDGKPQISMVDHIEMDAAGNPASVVKQLVIYSIPILLGLVLCVWVFRWNRKRAHEIAAAGE